MEQISDIAELCGMLRQLRATDTTFRIFGSETHRYSLCRTLSEGEVAAFESTNSIRLPDDYRRFLTVVCNGLAGPHYGLTPLSTDRRNLSRPFPLTETTTMLTDEEYGQLFPDFDNHPGILEVSHHGCGIYSYLVVNGPTYGTIWEGREDFCPSGLTFGVWYRRWLELALRTLDNERRLAPRLRVGMTSAEVVAETGGVWKTRPSSFEALRYFEADDIPAQLLLDERNVVVEVRPWSFIAANPW